ncbi:TerC family protein [Saccharibacillus sp. CPCC 101409]|uniref:TerC family protein n=1 Tax=Saccharibacillus sp. CPCC 101409 TaxID=3058041 RepID=UPI0026740F87|nr:TerC family protein [Saccharibacillus sp. CPCC 101409]MDO3408522.1 TerC family protein [Saccharibacillus sp. CPCC 101409]
MADFFQSFFGNFANYFQWEHVGAILSEPATWGVIGTLIILEGLLSADNALVLAVMVRHLPPAQRKKALFYGILGAYAFRFVAIGVGTFLVKITWVKVLGGLYLLWIAMSNLFDLELQWKRIGRVPLIPKIGRKLAENEAEEVEEKNYGFWRTVLAVELMDIAFSIDSVLAAFGISQEVWVLLLGGMIGVLMMRGVAQLFLKLLEKFPELERAAFILITIIGLKMLVAALFDYELPQGIFYALLLIVFGGTILLSFLRQRRQVRSE